MSAEKPSTLPQWATGGTIVEPDAGKKTTGWEVAERPPAQYFNWLFNLIYQWTQYLQSPKGTGAGAGIDALGGDTSGPGLKGTGGSPNGAGLSGVGTGTGPGVIGVGAGTPVVATATTGSAVVGKGGQTNGFGGEFFGKGSGNAVVGTAETGGNGGRFFGAGTSSGINSTGGTTNGSGIHGTGGGTDSIGVLGTGVGTGAGTKGTSAGLGGVGALGDASAADGYGVAAIGKTSAPAYSALRVSPQSADPTTPTTGDTYVNSTTGKLSTHNGTTFDRYVPQSFASVVAGTAITGNTSQQHNQKYTIPANSLRVGSTIRIRAFTDITARHSPDTVTTRLRLGTTVLNNGTFSDDTGEFEYLEMVLTVRAIGASGSIVGMGTTYYINGTSLVSAISPLTATSIDTTGALDVAAWSQWSSANVGNSIVLQSLVVDVT